MTTTEIISTILTFLTVGGGALATAMAKLWSWVDKQIIECQNDRKELYVRIEENREMYAQEIRGLNQQLVAVSKTVGRMEEHLGHIDSRRDIDKKDELKNRKAVNNKLDELRDAAEP